MITLILLSKTSEENEIKIKKKHAYITRTYIFVYTDFKYQ